MKILMLSNYEYKGKTFFKGEKYLVTEEVGELIISESVGTVVLEKKVKNITEIAEDYTTNIDDEIILADATDGAIVVTLADAETTVGLELTIKKVGTGTNNVIFTADGATQTLGAVNDVATIISDGTKYLVISSNIV